jgi:hypothetical protein
MNQDTDPRTSQRIEVSISIGIVFAIHLIAFIVAGASMGLITREYLVFCGLVLPIMSLVGCIILHFVRGWRWGEVALVTLLAMLLSFVQILIVGAATAAV